MSTLPNDNLKQIYNMLQIKKQPFTKRKSIMHKRKKQQLLIGQLI